MAETLPPRPTAPVRIAISECLLGNAVRFDGSGARSSFPHAALAGLFEYQGICPEIGIGMSTPRQPIRLVGDPLRPRVVSVISPSQDFAESLQKFGRQSAAQLTDVCGYVFMQGSPSCGLYRVKVYPSPSGVEDHEPERRGRGVHAASVIEHCPDLPVEENTRLQDLVLRENFVTRTFAYRHWQLLVAQGVTAAGVLAFHSRYKYLLMAHSAPHYRAAGRLLSDLQQDQPGIAKRYVGVLMAGLARPATRRGHANVLSHLQGYLKRVLDSASRRELHALIEGYRLGEQPLLVPISLLKLHFWQHPDDYAMLQVYLDPVPPKADLKRPL